jgi:hypothetical protein
LHESLWQHDPADAGGDGRAGARTRTGDEAEPEPGQEREVRLTYLNDVILFDFRVSDDATTVLWKLELSKQPCSLMDE